METKERIREIADDLYDAVSSHYYLDLKLCLEDLSSDLERLAKDLDKPVPNLELTGTDVRIGPDGVTLIQDTFIHLLRNMVDHGIEDADIRAEKSKSKEGLIKVEVSRTGDKENPLVRICIWDDGQGVPIDRVSHQALSTRIVSSVEGLSDYQIINLIFNSGVSTAASVSEISGRGVGMGAI